MIKNYLTTGTGKDYLLSLLKYKNINKQMQHAAGQLFKDTFDGVLLPSSSLEPSEANEEHVVSSVAQC